MSRQPDQLPQDQSNSEWVDEYDGHGPQTTQPSVQQFPNQQSTSKAVPDDGVFSEPLIPAGKYKVVYQDHMTSVTKGSGKLRIRFAVCEGDYQGSILSAFYPCKLKGPAKKFGKFNVSKQSHYFDQMCNLFPDLAGGRSDRVSPQRLRGHTIIAEVSTVKTNWSGKKRKPVTQYSKVSKMLSLADCS